MAEVLLFNIIDIGFAINVTARGDLESLKLVWVILISALIQAVCTCHYLLAIKRIWLAKIFNCIQTMSLTIAMTEKSLLLGQNPDTMYVVLLSIITSISFMGTFQGPFIIAYTVSCVYKLCRLYDYTDEEQWWRSSTYFVCAFIMMFVLARANIERQSEMFS